VYVVITTHAPYEASYLVVNTASLSFSSFFIITYTHLLLYMACPMAELNDMPKPHVSLGRKKINRRT
jgi:hypothetical protein